MKKIILLFILAFSIATVFSQSAEIATVGGTPNIVLNAVNNAQGGMGSSGNILFSNGSLINSPGTGFGGADESVLQNASLSMNTLGFGFQVTNNNFMADDFTLANISTINTIKVYAYQTGSTTTSTITDIRLKIYDDNPSTGGALVWGDESTNRLINSNWSGIYRVNETSSGATNRPIMECLCEVNTTLIAGTYWLEIQAAGSLSSGPWCPPISINGVTTTGNALQNTSGTWENALDSGTSTQQGFPFVIYGSNSVPFNKNYILILFGLIGIGVVVKRMF